MKHQKLAQALDEVSNTHITEASRQKKRLWPVWFGAVAAVLAAAIVTVALTKPMTASATGLIAAPVYEKKTVSDLHYAHGTEAFFQESLPVFLSGEGTENTVCSPLNIYLTLSMLAQCTEGESRQQILDLLGADSIEALQTQASCVWNAHYQDKTGYVSLFANSIWLDDGCLYNDETVDILAREYYASVYQGDLGSKKMDKALQNWLNEQTRGLLQEASGDVQLDPLCSLVLVSTVYYACNWEYYFYGDETTPDIFHSPDRDTEVPFMHTVYDGQYYWAEDFSAVAFPLEDGSAMWLILPDEGVSTGTVLQDTALMSCLFSGQYPHQQKMTIGLDLPKFDVTCQQDLVKPLQALGITHAADPETADFSPILPEDGTSERFAYLYEADHAVRVSVDEDGVLAAAYTSFEIMAPTSPAPEELEFIRFTLNRPFLFVIESKDGLPLFAGVVNEP